MVKSLFLEELDGPVPKLKIPEGIQQIRQSGKYGVPSAKWLLAEKIIKYSRDIFLIEGSKTVPRSMKLSDLYNKMLISRTV